MTRIPHIEGASINDIMANEDWQLGASLDALDDPLHGSYGALAGHAATTMVWRDIAHGREALGRETRFNGPVIQPQLTALSIGQGQAYFEIVMEIFGSHPQITLVPG